MPGFNFFFIASLRQNLSDVFPALVSWNAVWLQSLGMTCCLFVCVCFFFWLPLFLNRSACDKFNADGFTFNHSKQKKISFIGVCWAPLALKTFLDKQT